MLMDHARGFNEGYARAMRDIAKTMENTKRERLDAAPADVQFPIRALSEWFGDFATAFRTIADRVEARNG